MNPSLKKEMILMKALIWFLCFFVLAVVQMLIKDAGIILGGIPAAILFALTWWSAKKLCNAWDKHKAKKAAETASRQAANKALAQVLAAGVVQGTKAMKANTDAQQFNLNDPEYGLVPEKPVYCCYVDGSRDYLNSLRTENGEKLEWNRRGSMHVDDINGMVDIYDSTLPSGQAYKTVYVNMYSDSNSTTAPAGFVFHHSEKKTVTPAPAPSKSKPRFCKLCGDPIDPMTRKCTGCKKQYFRPPVLTDKHYFIAATAVACIVVAFLLVMLISQRSTYEAQVAELTTRVSDLETRLSEAEDNASYHSRVSETRLSQIEDLRKKIEELEDRNSDLILEIIFYDQHVVFVGDDGTRKYHKYDCPYLDLSYFWAYNTEAAVDRGYKPCSHCCG